MIFNFFKFLIPYCNLEVENWKRFDNQQIIKTEFAIGYRFPKAIKEYMVLRGGIGLIGLYQNKIRIEKYFIYEEKIQNRLAKTKNYHKKSKLFLVKYDFEDKELFWFVDAKDLSENPPVYIYESGQEVFVKYSDSFVEYFLKSEQWHFIKDEYREEIEELINEGKISKEDVVLPLSFMPDWTKNGYKNYFKNKGKGCF